MPEISRGIQKIKHNNFKLQLFASQFTKIMLFTSFRNITTLKLLYFYYTILKLATYCHKNTRFEPEQKFRFAGRGSRCRSQRATTKNVMPGRAGEESNPGPFPLAFSRGPGPNHQTIFCGWHNSNLSTSFFTLLAWNTMDLSRPCEPAPKKKARPANILSGASSHAPYYINGSSTGKISILKASTERKKRSRHCRKRRGKKKGFRKLNPKGRSELRVGAADMAREGKKNSGVARRPRNQQHATPAKSPSGIDTKKLGAHARQAMGIGAVAPLPPRRGPEQTLNPKP